MFQINGERDSLIPDEVREVPNQWTELLNPEGNGETILVVEDEEKLRGFLQAILHKCGYRVLPAADGTEGVRKFAANKNEIDLVLLDMGLPGLSGEEVLSMILALQSHAKVIAVSGLIRPEVRDTAIKMGASDYLSKPYLSDELLVKVRDTLRSRVEMRT